jgi:hypothetical protein
LRFYRRSTKIKFTNDIFFKEPFFVNGVFDPELILQDTEYLFVAANVLFQKIKSDIDLAKIDKLFINYTRELDFSLVFVL